MIMQIIQWGIVVVISLLAFVGAAYYINKRKIKISKDILVLGVIVGVIASLLSGVLASHTGILYENITFTALGEHNEEAVQDEIAIKNYLVDTKEYPVQSPKEGKWFWNGNTYMWRNESDSRQPEGTTRSIVMRVPVGFERSINFAQDKWKGLVEIELDGNKTIVDCYVEGENYNFPSNGITVVLGVATYSIHVIMYIVLFTTIILLCMCAFANVHQKLHAYRFHIVYFIVALSSLFISVPLFDKKSLWEDEFYQISFVLTDSILYSDIDATPPLFRIISSIWYNIVPYGQGWLILLSALLVCGAIYVMGLVGKEICNPTTGVMCAFFTATSTFVISHCSLQFRGYSLLLLCSSLFLLYTIKRIKKGNDATWLDIVKSGLVTIPLTYTHYFGVLLCITVFFIDLLLWLFKKVKIKTILTYIIPFLAFMPCIPQVLSNAGSTETKWTAQPSINQIIEYINLFCSENPILIATFYIGIASCISLLLIKLKNGNFLFEKDIVCIIPLLIIIIMFTIIYLIGILRPNATLWHERYLICIIPCVFSIIGYAIYSLVKCFEQCHINVGAIIATSLCFITLPYNYYKTTTNNYKPIDYYKQCSEWICSQANYIYNEDTVLILSGSTYIADAMYEYYITEQGNRDDINYLNLRNIRDTMDEADFDKYNVIIYCAYPAANAYNGKYINSLTKEFETVAENDKYKIYVYERA